MDASRIHEDITHMLYKVEEQYARIIQFNNNIPTLEIDLALKDIQELYECFLDLKSAAVHQRKTNLASLASKAVAASVEAEKEEVPVAKVEVVVEKPVEVKQVEKVVEIKAEEIQEKINTEAAIEEKEPKEVKVEEVSKTEESPSPIAWQKTINGTEIKEDVKAKTPPANVSVLGNTAPNIAPKVDLLKEREKDFVPTVRKIEFKPEPSAAEPKKESIFEKAASLYDKIAKPVAEKTVTNTANRQPISNIKSAIGINEKFIYLKELFKNNVTDYNEALEKLNNFDSYSDAEDCFQDMKTKYSWDPESKSFQGLAELLNRRYLFNS
jgi:hypothetical protein